MGLLSRCFSLYARKVIGWAISNNPDRELTKKSLRMAFESRGIPKKLLFYSNQGCTIPARYLSSYCGATILGRV